MTLLLASHSGTEKKLQFMSFWQVLGKTVDFVEFFSVILIIKNYSPVEDYKVSIILRIETVLYTGKFGEPVKKSESDRFVKPDSEEEVRLDCAWEEYGPRLLDQSAFNISCLATVKDTNYEYFAQDDFRVRKPDIKIIVRILNFLNECL